MMLEASTTYTPFQIYNIFSWSRKNKNNKKPAEKNSNKQPKHKNDFSGREIIKLVLLDQGTFKLSVGWVTTKSIFHISPLP